jgi:prophage regulatory protein
MEHGNTKGRLMRVQELTTVVPYSPQHIRRLEYANQFPRRVRIGANRVGWVREEVELWLANRIGGR